MRLPAGYAQGLGFVAQRWHSDGSTALHCRQQVVHSCEEAGCDAAVLRQWCRQQSMHSDRQASITMRSFLLAVHRACALCVMHSVEQDIVWCRRQSVQGYEDPARHDVGCCDVTASQHRHNVCGITDQQELQGSTCQADQFIQHACMQQRRSATSGDSSFKARTACHWPASRVQSCLLT